MGNNTCSACKWHSSQLKQVTELFGGQTLHILLRASRESVLGEGTGDPLQYSCLENPTNGGAWQAAVRGVAKSQTRLSDFTFTFMHWRRKWQPTPVFLPGESQGQRSLVGCRLWGRTESDTTEATQQQRQQQRISHSPKVMLELERSL